MNNRMAELLAKQGAKLLGVSGDIPKGDAGEEVPRAMPPFVATILAQFGITPASIEEYANILKNAVLEMRADMAEMKARQISIEQKLVEIEHNIGALQAEQVPELEPAPDLNPRVVMSDEECMQRNERDIVSFMNFNPNDTPIEDISYRTLEIGSNGR